MSVRGLPRRVGDAVADAIAAEGVTAAFGLLGEGNITVAERLHERGDVRWLAARREDAAVSMADGYARRRGGGSVAFATVTHGPGLTNALTALTEASKARTPLVALVGDTGREDLWHPQAVEERAFIEPTGAGVHTVRSAATAIEDVAIAFGRARREARPVALLLSSDLADAPYEGPPVAREAFRRHERSSQRLRPHHAVLDRAVERLRAAKRPFVLVGQGAVRADARDDIVALADAVGALLGTTLAARGLFRGHRCHVGAVGGFGDPLANDLLARADLVLAFGTSLSDWTTKARTLIEDAHVLRFDLDPTTGGDLVLGDVCASAAGLLERLPAEPLRGYRTSAVLDTLAAYVPGADVVDASGAEGLDARTVAIELNRSLPSGRAVVVDVGYFMAEACRYLAVDGPHRFIFPFNFGSIGLALATAAGASVAESNDITVAAVGDGGLMMSIGELETLRRLGLPVVVIVFNDAAYGIEYHALRIRGADPSPSIFGDVDFAAVARGFGLRAASVRTVEELGAVRALVDSGGPLLIDAKINRAIETDWLAELVRDGWHQHA